MMMINSIQQVETMKHTIRRVNKEIVKRRRAIKRNKVANAGIAREHLQQLIRQNNERKQILHLNRNRIQQLYRMYGGSYNKLRHSFLTPDGLVHKGNRGRPKLSIEELNTIKEQQQGRRHSLPPQPTINTPPTSKERKKQNGAAPEINVVPLPQVTVQAPPPQQIQQAADNIRQNTHVMAAEKAQAVRAINDAVRDQELISKGQSDLVTARKVQEAQAKMDQVLQSTKQRTTNLVNKVLNNATSAESKARSAAQVSATNRVAKSSYKVGNNAVGVKKSGGVATRARGGKLRLMGARGSGIVPQLALMTALSDKHRKQTLNNATRTQEQVVPSVIADQITEDVRQHKPKPVIHSKEFNDLMTELNFAVGMAKAAIAEGLKGKGDFGDYAKRLGPERAQHWANKGLSLVSQLYDMASNELVRWDQGSLNGGVAIDTASRSQSRRKMTKAEIKSHIEKKAMPIAMPFMNQLMEEVQRASTARGAQLGRAYNKVALGHALPVNSQRRLASADNIRGHGRPVLSEQQGTKGLAGLFPALRSSMQGVLKQ
jgi:hypothetical protein